MNLPIEKIKLDTGQLRERNRQRTTERIVKSAAELFRIAGYDHTTMDEIAERAEVSRATLFNYFPTKDSLLVPFVEEVLAERVVPSVTLYLNDQPNTFDALHHLFMCVYRYVLIVPDIDQALKREILSQKQVDQSKEDSFIKLLADVLRYGQRRGEIRLDFTAEKLAEYFGALCSILLFQKAAPLNMGDFPLEVDNLIRFIRTGFQPA